MITFFERENLRYAMIGSGSWATALVKLLLNHQQSISWFMRSQKNIDNIRENHHSRSYLQSVLLDPTRLNMSTDINEVIESADVLVFAVPSAYFMGVMLSGKLDQTSVQKLMKHYLYFSKKKKRNIEVAFHPGCAEENSDLISGTRKDFRKFYCSPWRNSEYEALMNIELSEAIKMMKEGY